MEDNQITIPANSVRLFLPIQLLTIINSKSGSLSQLSATWILKTLTAKLKEDIINAYGQEAYDELIAKYSKTAIEQTQDNIWKKQERLEKRRRREELEREKLELKKRELEIRQQNTENRNNVIEENQQEQENFERQNLQEKIEKTERQMDSVKARIEKWKDDSRYNDSNNLVNIFKDKKQLEDLQQELVRAKKKLEVIE